MKTKIALMHRFVCCSGAGGAPLSSRHLLGGLLFAPFAKGGPFFVVHRRLHRPIRSFLSPPFERARFSIARGELCCWARRICRTYGASEFLWGRQPSAHALG